MTSEQGAHAAGGLEGVMLHLARVREVVPFYERELVKAACGGCDEVGDEFACWCAPSLTDLSAQYLQLEQRLATTLSDEVGDERVAIDVLMQTMNDDGTRLDDGVSKGRQKPE